jgi:hypothetical protein
VVIFELGIKVGALERKLGKETIKLEISEWEMNSLLRALSARNKTMYIRIMEELINEAKSEGYEMLIGSEHIKIKCPSCKEEVEI